MLNLVKVKEKQEGRTWWRGKRGRDIGREVLKVPNVPFIAGSMLRAGYSLCGFP